MVAVECRMQEFAPNHPSFMCSSDGDDTPEVVVQRGRVMAYTFDSLGYAKKLRDGGVPRDQAEAHAEAARDFIMAELATKADLLALRSDLLATKQELQTSIETQALRLTVRLGTIVVVGLGALGAALKLI
jgi:hypothetical protein